MKEYHRKGSQFGASPAFFVFVLSLLFLFAALLVLVQRDIYGLETRVALFVRDILRGEGLFCPTLFGRPYPDYPPLYFLLSAPFCLLMGKICALCISVPSLLGATALLVLVFQFTRRHLGESLALVSSLILLSTPEFFLKAERATLDMLLALSVFSSNMFLFQGFWEEKGKSRVKKGLGFLFMALSYLVKGPVGIVLCTLPLAAFLALKRDIRRLFIFLLFTALTGGLVIGLHFLGLFFQGGVELVFRVLDAQFLSRISGRANKPFYFYFFYLFGAFSPWLLLIGALCLKRARSCIRQRYDCFSGQDFNIFVVIMASGTILPFLFATSRHGRYLLPAFPAISIILSCLLLKERDPSNIIKPLNIIMRNWKKLFFFAGLLLLLLFIIISGMDLAILLTLLLLFVAVFAASRYLFGKVSGPTQPVLLYGVLIFFLISGLAITLEPQVSRRESGRQFVQETERAVKSALGVYLFRLKPDGEGLKYCLFSRYYPEKITFFRDESRVRTLPEGAIMVVYERDMKRISKDLKKRKYKIISEGYIHNRKVYSLLFKR